MFHYGGENLLYKLNIELEKEKNTNFTIQLSSLFHGILMEKVPFEYGEKMHVSNIRPYSQFIQVGEEKILWSVAAVNDEAYEQLIKPLLQDDFDYIYIKYKNVKLKIVSKQLESKSMEEFLSETFFGNCSRFVKIKFITPCAFKSQGRYIFYPTVRYIMQSLVSKFDSGGHDFSVYTDELISDLEKYIYIIKYNLRSRIFSLEGVKIPSFSGEITVKIDGPAQMVNLANMLLKYGWYSGVGIKCAIGMGAVLVESGEVKRHGEK